MNDNFKIDLDNITDEEIDKLCQLALESKETEAALQRFAFPEPSFDFEAIKRGMTIAATENEAEPLIPEGYFEKTQEYQQKSLEILQSINENTANLYTMVELINQNNEKQDELIAIMTEVLSLAKTKSKKEADSLFKKIMGKIQSTIDGVDTMIKIVGWATTVYDMVIPMLK